MKTEKEIKKLYKNRFNEKEIKQENITWKVLCDLFFQKYIKKDSTDSFGYWCWLLRIY